jgi:hypothetical protein
MRIFIYNLITIHQGHIYAVHPFIIWPTRSKILGSPDLMNLCLVIWAIVKN